MNESAFNLNADNGHDRMCFVLSCDIVCKYYLFQHVFYARRSTIGTCERTNEWAENIHV